MYSKTKFFLYFLLKVIVLKGRNYIEHEEHTSRSINACYLVYLTKNNKKTKYKLKKNLKKTKADCEVDESIDRLITYKTMLNKILKSVRVIIIRI